MAHSTTHTHESNNKRIWFVFALLSVVTIVEVILGIIRPDFLVDTHLYKAYYIAWAFMHLEGESKGLRRAVVWTAIFLISYLMFILLTEGDYIFDVYKNSQVAWDF